MSKLFNKYVVRRNDGLSDEYDAQYFVLRIDKDNAARVALKAYADEIRWRDPELAAALDELLAPFDRTESGAGVTDSKAKREAAGGSDAGN